MSVDKSAGSPNGRNAAADRIASVAWSLEGHAEDLPGGKPVANVAHHAADALTVTSDYIRDHDLDAMMEDAKALVRKHPVSAILGAAALGFLITKAVSRK